MAEAGSVIAPPNSIHPKTRTAWRTWLTKNGQKLAGVWLITYKVATGNPRIDYDVAVEEALCVGWVDSKPRALDSDRSMLWFAPRSTGTGWSRLNKNRVTRLTNERLMLPEGLAVVARFKLDGSWSKLDSVEALELPTDLEMALSAFQAAPANFAAFPRSVKRNILEWIQSARKPETRAARAEETARLADKNVRANQWREQKDRGQSDK